MKYLRRLYGKAIIDSSDSEELQDDCKIELEYYQLEQETVKKPYGIEIIRRKVKDDLIDIENKIINHVCDKKQDTNKLLDILISNKVTPISVNDVICDLAKTKVI